MEQWKECRLGEVVAMKNGKKRPTEEGLYPVYGGNGIMGYVSSYNSENTIIIGRVGAYCGNVYYCKGKCWVSDNAISVKTNDGFNIVFLFYLMQTLNLHNQHIGGAQPLMTQDIIGNFNIRVPSLRIQDKIALTLSLLDDKIVLNQKINSNLECSTSISPDISLGNNVSRTTESFLLLIRVFIISSTMGANSILALLNIGVAGTTTLAL